MELKRLGFVMSYVSWATATGSDAYKKARSFVPGFVEPQVAYVEDAVTSYGAPLLNQAEDLASKLFQTADDVVDTGLNTLTGTLDYSRNLHDKNMKAFATAKDSYFSWLEGSVEWVKARINPYPYIQWGLEKVVAVLDPDMLVEEVSKVKTYPVVAKVLEVGEPVIKTADTQYQRGHEYLVSNPTYKKVYQNVETTLSTTTTHPLYRRARDTVWPVAEPVAGPVYDNFARSKYLAQLADHMRPKVA